MVLANSNKFAVVAFGIFVLGESRSWQAVLGCVVALSGGVWYASARSELEAAGGEGAASAAKRSPARLVQAAAVAALLLLAVSGFGMPAAPAGVPHRNAGQRQRLSASQNATTPKHARPRTRPHGSPHAAAGARCCRGGQPSSR